MVVFVVCVGGCFSAALFQAQQKGSAKGAPQKPDFRPERKRKEGNDAIGMKQVLA